MRPVREVGLGYIRRGQSAMELSGGLTGKSVLAGMFRKAGGEAPELTGLFDRCPG